ncbi:Protein MON2 homolog [Acanthosepion pharaonis]|uniref:Protein MON2 homolog n=1 Tax=Acanthosepion pharaonis TaxID=158019 RepID=A0A812D4W4_ACAPH|nr:Protein MON2 homolog [Sepia pharaonis]
MSLAVFRKQSLESLSSSMWQSLESVSFFQYVAVFRKRVFLPVKSLKRVFLPKACLSSSMWQSLESVSFFQYVAVFRKRVFLPKACLSSSIESVSLVCGSVSFFSMWQSLSVSFFQYVAVFKRVFLQYVAVFRKRVFLPRVFLPVWQSLESVSFFSIWQSLESVSFFQYVAVFRKACLSSSMCQSFHMWQSLESVSFFQYVAVFKRVFLPVCGSLFMAVFRSVSFFQYVAVFRKRVFLPVSWQSLESVSFFQYLAVFRKRVFLPVSAVSLFPVCQHPHAAMRSWGAEATTSLVKAALSHTYDPPLHVNLKLQSAILTPLQELSTISHPDIRQKQVESVFQILHSNGDTLVHGWPLVLGVIGALTNDQSEKLVQNSFMSLQLVVTDFLPMIPCKYLLVCVEVASKFGLQSQELNVSLTAIGLLLFFLIPFFGIFLLSQVEALCSDETACWLLFKTSFDHYSPQHSATFLMFFHLFNTLHLFLIWWMLSPPFSSFSLQFAFCCPQSLSHSLSLFFYFLLNYPSVTIFLLFHSFTLSCSLPLLLSLALFLFYSLLLSSSFTISFFLFFLLSLVILLFYFLLFILFYSLLLTLLLSYSPSLSSLFSPLSYSLSLLLSYSLSCSPPLLFTLLLSSSLIHSLALLLSCSLSCSPPLLFTLLLSSSLIHSLALLLSYSLSCSPFLFLSCSLSSSLIHPLALLLSYSPSSSPPLLFTLLLSSSLIHSLALLLSYSLSCSPPLLFTLSLSFSLSLLLCPPLFFSLSPPLLLSLALFYSISLALLLTFLLVSLFIALSHFFFFFNFSSHSPLGFSPPPF